eukprot:TRINITY_DN28216_c0_g1_i1.p1 TRINITY_DN28216_c0_g1~~TRINITY_DN28216_c0_g1_i1.p1  ORF type:complete len:466 (+),score=61.11 TRINITY_DN28216_c0_g1_i1:140-1537(+)
MCIRDRYQRRVRGAPWCSMLEEVGYSAGGHPCEELYWYGGGAAGVKGALPGVLLGLSTGIIFTVNTFVHGASEGCSSWPSWGPLMANSALVGMFGVGCFLAGGLLRSSRSPFAHLAAAHSASVLSLLLCSVGVAVCSSELYVIAACGVGFGVGIIYMAGMSVTLSWFQNRKVVATAIYSTVSGISSLALQRVNTSLSDSYGLEVTFFVLASTVALFGGVTCTVCEFGPYHIAQVTESESRTKILGAVRPWAFLLLCFCTWAPGWGVIVSLNPVIRDLFHVGESQASVLALVPLGALTLGRLSPALLGQHVAAALLFYVYAGVAGGAAAALGFREENTTLALLSVMTWAFGATSSSFATYAIDLFGTESYNVIIGFTLLAYGVSAMFSTFCYAFLPMRGFLVAISTVALLACGLNCWLQRCTLLDHLDDDHAERGGSFGIGLCEVRDCAGLDCALEHPNLHCVDQC